MIKLFGLLISISAYSQETDEKVFPESDAIWVIHLYAGYGVQYIYGLTGDTIVNEKQYSKLYLLNDSTLNIDENDIYVGGIRQEDKKVYIQPVNKQDSSVFEEFLMYDFSKKEGEELRFRKRPKMGQGYYCPTFECVDIDILEEESKSGRDPECIVLRTSNQDSIIHIMYYSEGKDTWIKGIGSLSGLYYLPALFLSGPGGGQGGELICMQEKGVIKYLKEGCTSCFNTPTVSLKDEKEQEAIHVKISNKSVELSTEILNLPYNFSILNIEGKELISYTISESNTNINLSTLTSGIYIYSLSGDNIKQTGKIIVQ